VVLDDTVRNLHSSPSLHEKTALGLSQAPAKVKVSQYLSLFSRQEDDVERD